MYRDTPLQDYLDDLASSNSTPGGGSASALSGAMAAGLASMVARLTLGRAEYVEVQTEVETIIEHTEQFRARFLECMQADIDAYGRLSACFKMPRTTAEERTARTTAIQARLIEAAQVPLLIMETSAQLLQYGLRVAQIGNKNVLSDIATSGALASGASNGASWMVRVNVASMKDAEQVRIFTERMQAAEKRVAELGAQIIQTVEERV